jgi:hypothetical protein
VHTDGFHGTAEGGVTTRGNAKRSKNELRGDTELMNVLRSAIESMKGEAGAAPMARIGQYISNQSSLSPKNYGYARWSDLIKATEYFDEVPGEQPSFRSKTRAKPSEPG